MNSGILTSLLSFLLLYKYGALFILILVAAIIVPIPVNTLLLAAGAFASQGYFSFTISLLVVVAANMLGDCFDFFLARRYGRRALEMLHIRIPKYLERLERFVRAHPGPAIFLTRFVGTIEPLTSLLCGFIDVPAGKFIFYDFLGNFVSDGAVLCAGYFLGSYWQDFMGVFNITDYIFLGAVIAIALVVMIWRKKHGHADPVAHSTANDSHV